MKKFGTAVLGTVLAAGLAVGAAGTADAQKLLRFQTGQAAGASTYKYLTEVEQPKVKVMTDGKIEIEILPTNSVIPYREAITAVAGGILQGDMNAPFYYAGLDPAFAILGDLVAAYDDPWQVQMFFKFGGGLEVMQKVYSKYGDNKIKVVSCAPYSKEAFVSAKPVRTVEDFKGLKLRSPEGLAAEVFRRVGATPIALPFSEVYTSLDKHIIDAADASSYTNNTSMGMHKLAKFPLFPGIHSQAVTCMNINMDVWNGLTPAQQQIMETWFEAAFVNVTRFSDIEDRKIAAADAAGTGTPGIEIIDWPVSERNKFRAVAQKAWEDFSKQSPLAKEAYDAQVNFLKSYGLLK